MSTGWSIVVGLVVVWVTVMLSMIEMKYGKWTGIIGTVVRLLTLFIFLALVVVFLVQDGKPEGTITVSEPQADALGFLAVIGLLQFMFVGFELSSGAAEEMTNPQKDVPKMILRSGLIAAAHHRLDDPRRAAGAERRRALAASPASPMRTTPVASVLGGAKTAFNWFICALDHPHHHQRRRRVAAGRRAHPGRGRPGRRGALWFGKFSKQGTPLTMNILSAIIGSVFVRARVPDRRGQPRDLLRHHGLGDHLAHGDDVRLPVPGRDHAAQEVPGPSPAVPRARRPRSSCGCASSAPRRSSIITIITLLWPGLLDNAAGAALRHRLLVGRVPVLLRDGDARHRRVLPAHGGRVLGHRQAQHPQGPRRRERPPGDRPGGARGDRGARGRRPPPEPRRPPRRPDGRAERRDERADGREATPKAVPATPAARRPCARTSRGASTTRPGWSRCTTPRCGSSRPRACASSRPRRSRS